MGVLLVTPQRRVRRHGPAVREIAVRVGTADVVDPAYFLGERFRAEIIRPHRVDEAERPALLAGAIVGQHKDESVVADAGGVEEPDQPGEVLVGVIEHAGKGRLQTREQAAFVGVVAVPRPDAVIALGQSRLLRDDPHRLLTGHALFALDIPAVCELVIVAPDNIGGRLMRRMAGAERHPGQPGYIGPVSGVIGDEADRLVDQIGRQMVALGIDPRRVDVSVVGDQFGRILIGLGIEKAVEAIEAAPQRPAVERPGGAAFGQRRNVPLANHIVAIAVLSQHFRQRAGLARDLAAIAGIAGVEVGEAADADRMVVASGQQRRARRRAHRGGMEAGIAKAVGRELVDGRRPDGRAVTAEIGKADIVEQHDQDVGRALRRLCRARPPWLRVRHRLADDAAERFCAACRHAFLPLPMRPRLIRRFASDARSRHPQPRCQKQ